MNKALSGQTRTGIVFLVGAGPGDPGLITVRGVECLQRAEVVVYDYLANEQLLTHAPLGAERIYAGKIGGRHNQDQGEINRLLINKAQEGHIVVRLKGGDPFIFGRGGEECEALRQADVPFEVVPGVTAAVGASAYAGIPLTHRDHTASVAFVTGQEGDDKKQSAVDWQRLSTGSGTVVFYMGVSNLRYNMLKMIEHGRPAETPVALVRWGTLPEQSVVTGTLADIADQAEKAGLKPPAVTIVGEVVNLREKLRWFDNRPLSGRKIMVTRAADQIGEFSAMLADQGASVIECPTIKIITPAEWTSLDTALAQIGRYAWLIFTSVNAVQSFFNRLHHQGMDARALGGCRVCAVGPKTAASLRSRGVHPDLMPGNYRAEAVVAEFAKMTISGKMILFPRADRAREVIPVALEQMGAHVDSPVVYRTVLPKRLPPEAILALERRTMDCITFTSSSTVSNLAEMLGANLLANMLKGCVVASIGPVTSQTCRELGLKVDIEPTEYTLAGLTEAITDFLHEQVKLPYRGQSIAGLGN